MMTKKIKQVTPEQNEKMLKVIEADSQKKKYQAVIYDEASVTPEQNEKMLKVIEGILLLNQNNLVGGFIAVLVGTSILNSYSRADISSHRKHDELDNNFNSSNPLSNA